MSSTKPKPNGGENSLDSFLSDCNMATLKQMGHKLGVNIKERKKSELIKSISSRFTSSASSTSSTSSTSSVKKKDKKYKTPLGKGKDGTTYTRGNNSNSAIKQFKKSKSPVKISSEVDFQKIASSKGISPRIIKYDLETKKIVMDKLDKTLYDILKDNNGKLTQKYQKRIIEIFKILDELKIFHADPSAMNFMEKDKQLYIIDFGFAKKITSKLAAKHNCPSENLNMEFMPLGLLLKLKKICPGVEYPILREAVPENKRYILDS